MRIDFQPGDHLRVGRFIICRARNAEGAPIIDGGSTGLVHHDEKAAVEALNCARTLSSQILTEDALSGEELTAIATEVLAAVFRYDDTREVEHFGSIVISPWRLAVGWKDARTPMPARWRPRYLLERARWVLAGRPANVHQLGTDNSAGCDDGAVPAVFDTPFGDPSAHAEPVELWRDPYGDGTPQA